ncbi:Transposase [Ralstonia sp. 25mfcol4.1]|nr:Transposase [Ralstonia sp. 25mfcol4.1]
MTAPCDATRRRPYAGRHKLAVPNRSTEAIMSSIRLFVGLDVHRNTIAIALAAPGRDGEIRFIGNFANQPTAIIAQLRRLEARHGPIKCAYEAGPCAYLLYRQLIAAGIRCLVAAPSKLPAIKGRVKNDHRDAIALARLQRAGDLVAVWVPAPTHEAMCDLVRARQEASWDVRKARQRIQSHLLLRDRHYHGKSWTRQHRLWISDQQFDHAPQQSNRPTDSVLDDGVAFRRRSCGTAQPWPMAAVR